MKILFLLPLFILSSCISASKFTSKGNEEKEKSGEIRFSDEKNKEEKSGKHVESAAGSDAVYLETVEAVASYYAHKFHGRKTASGEIYDMNSLSAAHINYPLGTIVKVTNIKNGKHVTLKINDRKPDTNGRAIDLSLQAAKEIEMVKSGIGLVRIDVIEWGKK